MQTANYYSRPSPSFGYFRASGADGPFTQGQGSGYGPMQQGVGILPPGSGPVDAGTGWSPTLTYLFVFIVAEIVAFGILGRVLR